MNKKGFTLVELLAVIVILAIIALIAVPIILNVIDEAKRGAAENSANGYLEAVEKQIALDLLNNNTTTITDGVHQISELSNVKVSGDAPKSGWIKIKEGKIIEYSFVVGEYVVTKNSDIVKGNTAYTFKEYKTGTMDEVDVIYYNPETNEKCSNATSTTGTKTGCMKWYVIKDSDQYTSTVDVILDHNTTAIVQYNSNGTNAEMNEVATALVNDTQTWDSSVKETARLITADEVAKITQADIHLSWHSSKLSGTPNLSTIISSFYLDGSRGSDPLWETQVANASNKSIYAWLYDYMHQTATAFGSNYEDNNTYLYDGTNRIPLYGYWTSTPVTGTSGGVWRVGNYGDLNNYNTADLYAGGVRPVITIQKTNL